MDYPTAPTGDTFVMPGWRRSLSTTGAGRLGWVDLGSASVAVRGGLSTLAWHTEDCTFLC
ncbi:hypothetical protein [Nostocoides veronense]|uniref:Uncharacterized protein n=1 Tax=Nostocoides veronense TaxID=330836 RepID=A0ABN2LI22_9MICO